MGEAVDTFLGLARRLIAAEDPALTPLVDHAQVASVLEDLEARTRHSVWNMQRDQPLATSLEPALRVGAVPLSLLVADERWLVFSPPVSRPAPEYAWYTEDPTLVAAASAAFLECWEASLPWQEAGLRPPLPERRLQVALLLLDGHSDREIAEELGVSARTVSAEVRAIVDWLGARSRSHAVAMLVGAG
ncbi:helix-turn-helix transcriptional regulator [Phycicoccus sp.]|uniref:helix-turn-helix transcriptional regulator n=1 Tax=Phycicoccus sp. TaxID=1902410 RepID=UPI002BA78196|nr:helix-turn-helix transcriptional regulator [Phycicoccus sp.]HMM96910.1 helix-turn-helix transcriptional regulator [Phycicoccus sp.]